MAPPKGKVRERLLADIMAHITEHGLGGLTLRQLAAAVGTTHRLLVYHFGSKEALLVEVVRCVEAQQRASLDPLLEGPATLQGAAQQMWARLSDPALWPQERLFFQLYGQALRGESHAKDLLPDAVHSWLAPIEALSRGSGTSPEASPAGARLLLAVTRGLLLDLVATGDREAVDKAMRHFLRSYHPGRSGT